MDVETTTDNVVVFECCGTHSSVAVNPEKAYRPVGGQGCCAHPWCERVKLAAHKPGASQGFSRSATGSGVDKGGLPEVPIWDNGVLRMKDEKPDEAVQVKIYESSAETRLAYWVDCCPNPASNRRLYAVCTSVHNVLVDSERGAYRED